jgi:hypothetical protein
MCCELCHSGNQGEFTAEMIIHFSGLKNIDDPGIPSLPNVSVCLDWGFSRFVIPQAELALLKKRRATSASPPQMSGPKRSAPLTRA